MQYKKVVKITVYHLLALVWSSRGCFKFQYCNVCTGVQDINIVWKRSVGDDNCIGHNVVCEGRHSSNLSDQGLAILNINDCCSSDAGFYSCTLCVVNQARLSITTSAYLSIIGKASFVVVLDFVRT